MRPLRIAVASAGRFHLLDLARELHALGHDVKFYSYVPLARAVRFGLPRKCHVSLLPFVFPILVWERLAPRFMPLSRERLFYAVINWALILKLKPCDIIHCMSGIYLEAARHARRRFGARIWLVRGSRHILSQDEILAKIPGAKRPSRITIVRELAGYALADRIDVPSGHVYESFKEDRASAQKLIRSPYGVDISMFPLRPRTSCGKPFTFITVGHWSLRKGSDVLQQAVKSLKGARLLHVGPLLDLRYPSEDQRFIHSPSLPQWELQEKYALSDAFVHASREDGFGVVLAQALASGLPVICTDRTGGGDLAHTPALAARITVVPHGDADALAAAMRDLQHRLCSGERLPPLGAEDLETLTWAAYARRYCEYIQHDLATA